MDMKNLTTGQKNNTTRKVIGRGGVSDNNQKSLSRLQVPQKILQLLQWTSFYLSSESLLGHINIPNTNNAKPPRIIDVLIVKLKLIKDSLITIADNNNTHILPKTSSINSLRESFSNFIIELFSSAQILPQTYKNVNGKFVNNFTLFRIISHSFFPKFFSGSTQFFYNLFFTHIKNGRRIFSNHFSKFFELFFKFLSFFHIDHLLSKCNIFAKGCQDFVAVMDMKNLIAERKNNIAGEIIGQSGDAGDSLEILSGPQEAQKISQLLSGLSSYFSGQVLFYVCDFRTESSISRRQGLPKTLLSFPLLFSSFFRIHNYAAKNKHNAYYTNYYSPTNWKSFVKIACESYNKNGFSNICNRFGYKFFLIILRAIHYIKYIIRFNFCQAKSANWLLRFGTRAWASSVTTYEVVTVRGYTKM